MAKRKTTTVEEDITGGPGALPGAPLGDIQEPLGDEALEEMLAIEDTAASLGAGVGQARVYRIERNGDPAFVGEFVAAELTEGKIQEEYGGGKYVVKFLNSQKQYVKQRTIIIAEPRKKDDVATALAQLNGKNGQLDMQAFLQLQLASAERAEARSQQMIVALIGALGNKNGNGGSSAAEIVQAVVALKGATEPTNGLFAGIEQVVKLAQVIGGKGEVKEDNAWSVIRDVAPGLVETLAKSRAVQPANGNGARSTEVREISPGTAQPLVIAAHSSAQPNPPVQSEDTMTKQIRLLKEAVEFLKEKARRNKDVDLMIDYVLAYDEGEDEKFDVLIGAMQMYSFETLSGQDAEITGNPVMLAWFKNFYDGLKRELQRNDDTAGPSGNSLDAPSNVAVSETISTKPEH